MARIFPRAAKSAVRVLKAICDDPDQPVQMRARSAELILAAYNLASLSPERASKHNGLRQIQGALELSGIDRKIAANVRKQNRDRKTKLHQELEKL